MAIPNLHTNINLSPKSPNSLFNNPSSLLKKSFRLIIEKASISKELLHKITPSISSLISNTFFLLSILTFVEWLIQKRWIY